MSRRIPGAVSSRSPRFESLEDRRMLAVLTVNSSIDSASNIDDGVLTLREAIAVVNDIYTPFLSNGDLLQIDDLGGSEPVGINDTILFAPTVFNTPKTITLTNGELTITESVTIDGGGPNITIDAGGDSRVFFVGAAVDVTLESLTITGGDAIGNGGGIFVHSPDHFELIDSTVTGNVSLYGLGGGLYVYLHSDDGMSDEISIKNSTIENNQAGQGGGIFVGHSYFSADNLVEVLDSTIRNNTAGTSPDEFVNGGGIRFSSPSDADFFNPNHYVISRSTLSGNTSYGSGGGIDFTDATGDLDIINSTLSGNRAVEAGGGLDSRLSNGNINSRYNVKISHSTIVDNEVGFVPNPPPGFSYAEGGGIAVSGDTFNSYGGFASAILDHVIIAGNRDLLNGSSPDDFTHDVLIEAGSPNDTPPQQKIKANYSFLGSIKGGNGGIPSGIDTAVAVGTNNQDDGLPFPNLIGTVLGPLQDNGGPTETHAPLLGSPVIDAGNPIYTPSNFPVVNGMSLTTDQRGPGFPRVFDAILGDPQIDIGAVEFQQTFDLSPRVTSVIISNTPPNLVLPATYDFANGTFDDPATTGIVETESIVGSGNQLRTVPVGGANTVEIVFSKPIDNSNGILENSLVVAGLFSETVLMPAVAGTSFDYDANTLTAKWTFASWDVADFYRISLDDAVTDLSGQALDGEWYNPTSITIENTTVSVFPSGDGIAGGDFDFVVTILPADFNISNTVSISDLSIIGANIGKFPNGGAMFKQGDATGDGQVTISDLSVLGLYFGVNLQSVVEPVDLDNDGDMDRVDLDMALVTLGLDDLLWADWDII